MADDRRHSSELQDIWEGRAAPREGLASQGVSTHSAVGSYKVVKKRRSSKRKRSFVARHKTALSVLAVLLVLVGGVALGVHSLFAAGRSHMHAGLGDADLPATLEHNGRAYQFNDNVVTVMFLGLDDPAWHDDVREGARLADANMLLAIDTQTGNVKVVGFPRDADTEVDIYQAGAYVTTATYQLAMAYSTDTGSDAACALNSCRSASRLVHNLPINYYITVDRQTIEQVTTDIGGVMVEAMDAPPEGTWAVGDMVNLMGEDAWWYLCARDTTQARSADKRLERQMQFATALVNKMRHADAGTILALFGSVRANVTTNLGMQEVTYLAGSFLLAGSPSVSANKIEGTTRLVEDADHVAREHVEVDEESVMRAVLDAYYTQVG